MKENLLKTKQTNKKTPFKQRPGSKEFTLKISNIQRTDTYPSQTLPNHWRAYRAEDREINSSLFAGDDFVPSGTCETVAVAKPQ